MSDDIEDKYISGDYIDHNPTWDVEHAPRKAKDLLSVINSRNLKNMFYKKNCVVEIGCGVGGVIYNFSQQLTNKNILNRPFGFDISPKAIDVAKSKYGDSVDFRCTKTIDLKDDIAVILLIDVLEHVIEPSTLLQESKGISDYFLIRLPLDLSLWNISLKKIPQLKKELGHIHYFTYISALNLIKGNNMEVLDYTLTNNFNDKSNRETKVSKVMWPVRLSTSFLSKRLNSLLWGGNSIVILAKVQNKS